MAIANTGKYFLNISAIAWRDSIIIFEY